MRLSKSFVTLLFLFSANTVLLGQVLPPETDFQIWNETTFVLPVVKAKDDKGKSFDKLSLLFITSLRLGQNRLAFVDERVGGGVDVALNKYFNLSPTYLYIASQPSRERREFEHRLRLDLTFNKKFKHFQLRDRNRLEYRIRHSRQDAVRYRNRFSVGVPVRRDGKELFMPFISAEPYYDFRANQWSRVEVSPGISKKFTDKLSADFFYNWRHNRTGRPADVHALGVNLKVKLR